ncbi:Similar to S.cerevisiae protein DCC1 (Subunit of a complex with Ctf8p and Ctf18p) [Malassezia sympodialis ATCC 42132]|uniref:Similar to S.cerevisiae protein DCC1 (Subunit of a complex with Ctf8p and Ctf18p) n=1 Tax=Malassezia sympodialis (strain ATCC 42132) TaxID=1230383 RepID=A0A1M8AA67_MALS4|nr:Similar to S.cerevisiae protein DCC1 (Subunit of a complex with Ctf8p and Ctf18p) [Malassezia sympodialis ATCC 42132]
MDTHVALVTPARDVAYDYRLIEVPPDLEAYWERGEGPLTFNGRANDEAVLVTRDATYAVRQVSQTNSLLLCGLEHNDNGELVLRMHQNARDTLELVRTSARLGRLAELLEADAYTGPDDEHRDERHYTWSEVRSIVQASEAELQQGLRMHHVVELDGVLRRVAPPLVEHLLRTLLAHLDVLACAPDRLPYGAVCDALAARSCRAVAEAVVGDWFCAAPAPCGGAVPTHVPLARADTARFLGLQLLRTAKRARLVDFLARWRAELGPLAPDAALPLLQGHYLLSPPPASFAAVSAHAAPPGEPAAEALAEALTIEAFSHTSLPLAPAQRFQDLFLVREQWVREELVPFIEPLAAGGAGASVNSLLLKHARSMQARWSRTHGAVLLRGALASPGRGAESCLLYQARVRM